MPSQRTHSPPRTLPGPGLAGLLVALLSACVVIVDNDFTGSDRHYSSGVRLQHHRPLDPDAADPEAGGPPEEGAAALRDPDVDGAHDAGAADDRSWLEAGSTACAEALDVLDLEVPEGFEERIDAVAVVGQQIYTPEDIDTRVLIEDDRPYAGWLFVGAGRQQLLLDGDGERRRDTLLAVELQAGVVGPLSGAETTQKAVHDVLGKRAPAGWSNQLENEPGILLRALRATRHGYWGPDAEGRTEVDLLSHVGGGVGNVFTGMEVGGTLRLGRELPRNFAFGGSELTAGQGHERVDPGPASFYGFAGVDGRLVLQDIFLDGNTFRDSHSVDRRPLVGALRVGLAWHTGGWVLAATHVRRTREFDGQESRHSFSSVSLAWRGRL